MSLILNNCIEYQENRKICIASEKGKTYTLNNTSNYTVKKVKVDKCLKQGIGEKRCDFLMHLSNGKHQRAFFIELKGSALADAVKQVYDTIIYLKKEVINCEINARIVGSGDTPDLANAPNYKKLAREVLKTKGTIKRATNKVLTENI